MIFNDMAIGSDSSSSTLSNMLSMWEDLKDKRENNHMEFKDHLHHKMLIIFSMLSTMLRTKRKTTTWSSKITFTTRCSSFFPC
jgi:hypothetical protein